MKRAFYKYMLIWVAFLSIPYFSTYNVTRQLLNGDIRFFFIPLLYMSLLFTGIFFLNLRYLLPNYLFKSRYFIYFLWSILCVLVGFLIPPGILYLLNIEPPLHSLAFFEILRPMLTTNILLMFILSFIGSIGLSIYNRYKDLEKENIAAQLKYLESQIHPHFLFNTLNSIYSLALPKSPDAAEMVEKLSSMMRYSITKRTEMKSTVFQEIEFIEDYLFLQRIRYKNLVKIEYSFLADSDSALVNRNLLIPFIENAFKHGVSGIEESIIFIRIDLKDLTLRMVVRNTITNEAVIQESTGLGIENTIGRLKLFYPAQHKINISDRDGFFIVELEINL